MTSPREQTCKDKDLVVCTDASKECTTGDRASPESSASSRHQEIYCCLSAAHKAHAAISHQQSLEAAEKHHILKVEKVGTE